ncbi:rhomboid family intramembrane serine protease [Chitinophaga sp. CB10]|uniref:rhomboid family intramembrane serine protease n=1 Tax=Chitinophaga sp. CB10 TaxID=1891659 RepID=UPI000A71C0A7|nr:rhomboid family intramembrane serine protease [Chitinophaga sp. CB10]
MFTLRPRGFHAPPVIKNLLIINGLVWLVQITARFRFNFDLDGLFALHYWKSDLFRPWQFITHLFMHSTAGPWHIGGNMLILWLFGSTLEERWGSKRFLLFYLICGLGAAMCYMGWLTYDYTKFANEAQAFFNNPTAENFAIIDKRFNLGGSQYDMDGLRQALASRDPWVIDLAKTQIEDWMRININYSSMVGASGAIYGTLFAFGYMYPNEYITYFFIPMRAKYFVGILIVAELYFQIQNAAGDNVAHVAHLGGALFAYLLLRNWNRKLF